MKLVAEQVKYLRERRKELLKKKDEYLEYAKNREKTGYEEIGVAYYANYHDDFGLHQNISELSNIEEMLELSEFVKDRNFDVIDIGTAFSVSFNNGFNDLDRVLLVEKGNTTSNLRFASLDSDLGKAVIGKREGDSLTYEVKATGRKISVSIKSIDKIRENYEHFICERPSSSRMSDIYISRLRFLKENNPDEYDRCFYLSKSQRELIDEEIKKIKSKAKSLSNIARGRWLSKLISIPVVEPPMDDTIGVGSKVSVLLTNDDGSTSVKNFEFINRAVSTELESHYVEAITPFGVAIAGLRANDTFSIRRKNKPSIKGIVLSVDNTKSNGKSRVL